MTALLPSFAAELVCGPLVLSGSAYSPTSRSGALVNRRQGMLAPSHCVSAKKARRHRQPSPDSGFGGDSGSDDGGSFGGWGGSGGWNDAEGYGGNGNAGALWVWQLASLCAFIQALYHVLTQERPAEPRRLGPFGLVPGMKLAVEGKEYGLAGYAGGRHQGGWGTENYIVPLGEGYLELAAVFDRPAAEQCDWGKLILASEARLTEAQPWTLVTFCVETPEGAPAIASRLDAELARMLRLRPDGSKLTWCVATMSRFDEPGRTPKPFFITWDDASMRPDKTPAQHKVEPKRIEYVEVAADKVAMEEWIGTDALDIRFVEGTPALKAVGIQTAKGTVVLSG